MRKLLFRFSDVRGFGLLEVLIAAIAAGGVTLVTCAMMKYLGAASGAITRRGEREQLRQWLTLRTSCDRTLKGTTPSGLIAQCHEGIGSLTLKDANSEPLPTTFGIFEYEVTCPKVKAAPEKCGCYEVGCVPCATQIQVGYRRKQVANAPFEDLFRGVPFPCEGTRAVASEPVTCPPEKVLAGFNFETREPKCEDPKPGVTQKCPENKILVGFNFESKTIECADAPKPAKVFSRNNVDVLKCDGQSADVALGIAGFFKEDLCAPRDGSSGLYVRDVYFREEFGEEFTEVPKILVSVNFASLNSPTGCLGQTTDRIIANWEPIPGVDLRAGFRIRGGSSPSSASAEQCYEVAKGNGVVSPERILKMDGYNSPIGVGFIAVGK